MSVDYQRGSEWRKCDLHFHTPSSYDYKDKSITDEKIIEELKANKIGIVAVTDHHFIDIKRIKKLRELAGEDLTVLAGIELRSELGGSESIHFIGIFPENFDLNNIWTTLQGKFTNLLENASNRNDDKIYFDLKEVAQVVHKDLGGIVSIHAGAKSNTIENITNSLPYKQTLKADILKDIDICEIGKPEDQKNYKTIVFPKIGQNKPVIICSDNHDIKNYSLKANCWIKAAPTFEGLKQIILEPEDRVYIGEIPPKIDLVNKNKTKYLNKISIKNDAKISKNKDIWFDNEIEFNNNLIAIIGNKGKGKSALAEIIGLLGNSKNFKYFSFLNKDKFKKNKLANNYVAEIKWMDGSVFHRNLMDEPNLQELERVKCIPQSYLDLLCTSLDEQFQNEIDNVVFSHIDYAEKKDYKNLNDIIVYKTSYIDKQIDDNRKEIRYINKIIIDYEDKLKPDYSKNLENKFNLIIEEIRSHCSIKPEKIKKPDEKELMKYEQKKLYDDLSKLNKETKQIEEQIKIKTNALVLINKKIDRLNIIRESINDIKRIYEEIKENLNLEEFLEINLEEIIKIDLNISKINDVFQFLEKQKNELSLLLDKNIYNSAKEDIKNDNLYKILEEKQKNKKDIQNKLNEPAQKYQKYLEEFGQWKLIFKNKNYEKKILKKERLSLQKKIPLLLSKEKEKRNELVKKLFKFLDEKIMIYKTLYSPIIQFIMQEQGKNKYMELNFSTEIMIEHDFNEKFLSFIDRNRKGTFQGIIESQKLIKEIVQKYDFKNIEELINFLNEIMEKLESEEVNGENKERAIESQLIQSKTKNDIYNFLYSLEYLKIDYRLKWGDKLIEDLSPGERGIVLLLFYLLIDTSDVPLIIDQPEDNLDNESIYNLLVKYIKQAKNRRQIFIVTHNPNLAVVCDAEQIIYCDLDKQNKYKISYETGSIENPKIKEKIINVLEGTKPAFSNRQNKYEL
jgi:hypothetical protein